MLFSLQSQFSQEFGYCSIDLAVFILADLAEFTKKHLESDVGHSVHKCAKLFLCISSPNRNSIKKYVIGFKNSFETYCMKNRAT